MRTNKQIKSVRQAEDTQTDVQTSKHEQGQARTRRVILEQPALSVKAKG